MKRTAVILLVILTLTGLCACNDENKAKGKVSESNGTASSIDVEVGN